MNSVLEDNFSPYNGPAVLTFKVRLFLLSWVVFVDAIDFSGGVDVVFWLSFSWLLSFWLLLYSCFLALLCLLGCVRCGVAISTNDSINVAG